MKTATLNCVLLASLCSASAFAAAPADSPPGSMGLCKDGTYSSAAEKKGACQGHKGVKEWYSDAGAAAAHAPAPGSSLASSGATHAASMPAAHPASMPAGPTSPAPERNTMGYTTNPTASPAPSGGGKVWVNTGTKVYHCSGDKYYGKTKQGEYMSEADAKAKGFHADHGKACA